MKLPGRMLIPWRKKTPPARMSITPKMLRYMVRYVLENISESAFGEPLSEDVRKKYKLVSRKTAFTQLHFPPAQAPIVKLEERIAPTCHYNPQGKQVGCHHYHYCKACY